MKYRMLTDDELRVFEPELKQFLVVNAVYDEEWRQINQENPDKARQLVALFSDQVLQTIYERIAFVEHRSKKTCLVFACQSDRLLLIGLQHNHPELDFSTLEGIHFGLTNHLAEIKWFKKSKGYDSDREMEIHQMLENGCVPSSGEFWESIQPLVSSEKNSSNT